MENKRASSGFIGTALGTAMTALQGTHPEWFGNHPWILPVSLLVLFLGLIFWITQIGWIQKLLGLRHPEQHRVPEPTLAPQVVTELLSPLQSKILVLTRNLRSFLQEAGHAPELHNPGPVKPGEDIDAEMAKRLSDADRWTGVYGEWARKRLYGYQSRFRERVKEAAHDIGAQTGMVVHPLSEYIDDVKPNIDFFRLIDLLLEFMVKLEKPAEQRRSEEERAAQERMALIEDQSRQRDAIIHGGGIILTPLQVRILRMAKALSKFLSSLGPMPKLQDDQYDSIGGQEWITRNMSLQEPWFQRLRGGFATGFADELKSIYEELWANGMQDYDLRIESNESLQVSQLEKAVDGLWSAARKIDEKP